MALDVDGVVSVDTPVYTVDGIYSGSTQIYPGMRIELAFGFGPSGTSGGADIPDDAWTDITSDVRRGVTVRRGKSGINPEIAAGECTFTIVDQIRLYDPTNAAGTYYGQLAPRTPVRVCTDYLGVSYCLFRGFIQSFPQQYDPSNRVTWIEVQAFDLLSVMARWSFLPVDPWILDSATDGILDTGKLISGLDPYLPEAWSGDRIGLLLDTAGIPAVYTDIDQGSSRVRAGVPDTRDMFTHLQKVVKTELGRLWVSPDGVVTYRDRRHDMLTPAALFLDTPGWAICYQSLTIDPLALDLVLNEASRKVGDNEVTARDATSIDRYGTFADSDELLHANVSDARQQAQYLVGRYSEPVPRIRSIVVKPGRYPETLFPGVLAWDLGTVLVIGRTPNMVGSAFTQTVVIESIDHTFDGSDWTTTYELTQPDLTAYWRLDDPTSSALDADNLIAY